MRLLFLNDWIIIIVVVEMLFADGFNGHQYIEVIKPGATAASSSHTRKHRPYLPVLLPTICLTCFVHTTNCNVYANF